MSIILNILMWCVEHLLPFIGKKLTKGKRFGKKGKNKKGKRKASLSKIQRKNKQREAQ